MKLLSVITLFVAPLFVSVSSAKVTWDPVYDQPGQSLDVVTCYGLKDKGFNVFGDLTPAFPNIGGSSVITGSNSPNCGSCWNVTYDGTSVIVMAIDHAGDGYNLSEEAMNTLTKGKAEQLGSVYGATSVQVADSFCHS